MGFEQKDNSGVIFKNDKREGNENAPHGKGTIMVAGVEYWLSAWTNTDKNGNKYQKVSVQPKENQGYSPQQQNQLQAEGAVKASGGERPADFDEEIPF